jgi:hypothetical protein
MLAETGDKTFRIGNVHRDRYEDIILSDALLGPVTGGEPTLLGDDFFRILRAMKSYLPQTAVHILSNGRLFAAPEFAKQYADIRHFDNDDWDSDLFRRFNYS